jgi:hypothetical protein
MQCWAIHVSCDSSQSMCQNVKVVLVVNIIICHTCVTGLAHDLLNFVLSTADSACKQNSTLWQSL